MYHLCIDCIINENRSKIVLITKMSDCDAFYFLCIFLYHIEGYLWACQEIHLRIFFHFFFSNTFVVQKKWLFFLTFKFYNWYFSRVFRPGYIPVKKSILMQNLMAIKKILIRKYLKCTDNPVFLSELSTIASPVYLISTSIFNF